MVLFALEHSKTAYRADFGLYGAAIAAVCALLATQVPHGQLGSVAILSVLGLAGGTAVEYALNRFVLQGLQPFRRCLALHQSRPAALICAPTILGYGDANAGMRFTTVRAIPAVWRHQRHLGSGVRRPRRGRHE